MLFKRGKSKPEGPLFECYRFVNKRINKTPLNVKTDIESSLLMLIQFRGVLKDEGMKSRYNDIFQVTRKSLIDNGNLAGGYESALIGYRLKKKLSLAIDDTAGLLEGYRG